jgi:hypothetical protein
MRERHFRPARLWPGGPLCIQHERPKRKPHLPGGKPREGPRRVSLRTRERGKRQAADPLAHVEPFLFWSVAGVLSPSARLEHWPRNPPLVAIRSWSSTSLASTSDSSSATRLKPRCRCNLQAWQTKWPATQNGATWTDVLRRPNLLVCRQPSRSCPWTCLSCDHASLGRCRACFGLRGAPCTRLRRNQAGGLRPMRCVMRLRRLSPADFVIVALS